MKLRAFRLSMPDAAHPDVPGRRTASRRLWLHLAGLSALSSTLAQAQSPASRPTRVVLQYSAGSGPDTVARQLAEAMGRASATPWLVDNRPGANGWLAAGEVRRAQPDGLTLLMTDNTAVALQPLLYRQLPFDPVKDFEPVLPLYATWFFIVVAADSPWKTVADLVAAAKARPGGLTSGSLGLGGVQHLGTALFEQASGTPMTLVPYKDMMAIYTDVSAGRVDWAFGTAATVGPLTRSGKLRLLALAAPSRHPQFPEVPTVAQAGGPPALALKTWVGLYAPRGTPQPVREQVQSNVRRALGDAAVREFLASVGFEAWPGGPAELVQAAEADRLRFASVVQQARIALD